MVDQLLIGVAFSSLISIASYVARFLTLSGSIAQFVLGSVLLGLGGWQWTVPILVFFLLSSILSKVGKRLRAEAELHFEKSSQRDFWQVAAHGGVAGVTTLLWFLNGNEILYASHVGAIAAAAADTWGTEIGTLSRSSPLLITTFKEVKPGRSGAVSILGLIAALFGAVAVSFSALPWVAEPIAWGFVLSVILAGFAGTLVDSLLGATIQTQYKCTVCDRQVERKEHCQVTTTHVSGIRWIGNDLVNLACTVAGGVFALLFGVLLGL